MFSNQVRQIAALPPPPGADNPTAAWWQRAISTITAAIGDCDQALEHNGPILVDVNKEPTTFDDSGNEIPLPPFTPEQVQFHTTVALPPAQITIPGSPNSSYDPVTNIIVGPPSIVAGGVSIFEDLIIKGSVHIDGDLIVDGNCNCDSGGGGGTTGSTIKQFTLTDPLLRFGSAAAVIDGAAVTVVSVMGQHGVAGRTGWALQISSTTWHILWLDNEPIRFILKGNLLLNGTALAKQVVGTPAVEVGPTFTVRSWHRIRHLGRIGAFGTAVWFQDDASAAMIIDLEHDAEWIVVRAKQDMPSNGVLTAELVRYSRGLPPVAVGQPITVYDKDSEFGLVKNGALLYCVLWDQDGNLGEYHIQRGAKTETLAHSMRYDDASHSFQVRTVQAVVHCSGDPSAWTTAISLADSTIEAIVDWRISGFNYDVKTQKAWVLEVDPASDWITKATGQLCTTP